MFGRRSVLNSNYFVSLYESCTFFLDYSNLSLLSSSIYCNVFLLRLLGTGLLLYYSGLGGGGGSAFFFVSLNLKGIVFVGYFFVADSGLSSSCTNSLYFPVALELRELNRSFIMGKCYSSPPITVSCMYWGS